MHFATLYDYRLHIKDPVRNMVTDVQPNLRLQAERYALEEIRGYLCHSYDVAAAFNHPYFDLDALATYYPRQSIINALGEEFYCLAQGNPTQQYLTPHFVKVENKYFYYDATQIYNEGEIVSDLGEGIQYLCIATTTAGDVLTDKNKFALRRNDFLLKIYIDIALYHIHSRIHQDQVTGIRIERYNDAIEDLKMIRKGLICLALPRTDSDGDGVPDVGGSSTVEIQSNRKRNYDW
jgi:Protein of unknown function (DUF1320)